jgi:hypothetical protein
MKLEMTVGIDIECSPKRYIASKDIEEEESIELALEEMLDSIVLAARGVKTDELLLKDLYEED